MSGYGGFSDSIAFFLEKNLENLKFTFFLVTTSNTEKSPKAKWIVNKRALDKYTKCLSIGNSVIYLESAFCGNTALCLKKYHKNE